MKGLLEGGTTYSNSSRPTRQLSVRTLVAMIYDGVRYGYPVLNLQLS